MENLRKFLDPEENPKVTHTDNSSEFRKACEHFRWNRCTSTHRSEADGLVDKVRRRGKPSTRSLDSMNNGGQILRKVIAVWARLLVRWGKTPYERRLGEPSCGQSYFSEPKSNIIRYQRKIRRGSISSVRKSSQTLVWATLSTWEDTRCRS